jgi:plastocyanin
MHSTKPLVLVVGLLVAAFTIGACGGSSGYTGGAPACSAATATATTSVSIRASAFTPACITVAPGATVTFTNSDSISHTVTADGVPAAYDSGDLAPSLTFQHLYAAAGTSSYHCNIHTGMKGTVIVQ